MSHHSDDEGSEAQDRFAVVDDDLGLPISERIGGLLRSLSGSNLGLHDLGRNPSPDSSPRHQQSHSRQLSRCSSRRSIQDDQSRRLSSITHNRTDEILSEIVEDELAVKKKFSGKRSSCRDKSKKVEDVLYADAATIRSHLEQMRSQARNTSDEKTRTAGTTEDSKLLLLRKIKRNLREQFQHLDPNRTERLNKQSLIKILGEIGIIEQQPSEGNLKTCKLINRFWSIMTKDSGSDASGITFTTFYRYTIVIVFPILLRLLDPAHEPTTFEKQFIHEASLVPSIIKGNRRPIAFEARHDAAFISTIARGLIENANLIRLLQPIRQAQPSSEDEFDFHPEITPRSERLARRRRQQSGLRRFTEELQQHAREAQRRRDADEARKYETELEGCTFRPSVNSKSMQCNRSYDAKTRFERLYQIGVHQVEDRRRQQRARSESPLPYRPFHMKSIPAAVTQERPLPKGFQENVERSRRAFRQRLRKKAEHDHLGQQFVERYDRRERRAARSAASTRSHSMKRTYDRYSQWYEKLLRSRRRPVPLLYVDVNIGHGRTGQISIYQDSNPEVLSRNFARIFDLDRDTQERLTVLLEEHCKRIQGREYESYSAADNFPEGTENDGKG